MPALVYIQAQKSRNSTSSVGPLIDPADALAVDLCIIVCQQYVPDLFSTHGMAQNTGVLP